MTKKTIDKQAQLISARAEGKPFALIAEELGVSKPTLLAWARDLQGEIDNMKSMELELLMERYYLTTERRLKLYGEKIEQILRELDHRVETGELAALSTTQLFSLMLTLHSRLEKEAPQLSFKTSGDIEAAKRELELRETEREAEIRQREYFADLPF